MGYNVMMMKAYDETYEVIIFKIHRFQETFLEHENLS